MNTSPDTQAVGVMVAQVAEALGDQIEGHVELVKAVLARDARALGKDIAPLFIGGALSGVGYLFGCAAGALALSVWLGHAGGFAVMSALNLLFGGLAIQWSLKRLRARKVIGTNDEVSHVQP